MATAADPGESLDCPVCELEDASEKPGDYNICERCGWENDPVQGANPDFPGRANRTSLKEAREAWREGRKVE